MPTPDIIKVFREKFGTGYVDPLNHSVREIVRDEHEKFILNALTDREKEIVAGIEGMEEKAGKYPMGSNDGVPMKDYNRGYAHALYAAKTKITKGEI